MSVWQKGENFLEARVLLLTFLSLLKTEKSHKATKMVCV